jgi:peptidoglycan/xylan/chitin deacetylase (PgdA/CDA1 family)
VLPFGIDFDAEDWTDISPERVMTNALSGIEAKKKGVLLLHDIQERTAAMLPALLKELKKRGYKIVHVVPLSAQGSAALAGPTSTTQKR